MRTCVVGFQSFLSVFSCNDLCMPSWDFLCQQHGFSYSPPLQEGVLSRPDLVADLHLMS